jgi:hypothetical protein
MDFSETGGYPLDKQQNILIGELKGSKTTMTANNRIQRTRVSRAADA